MQQMQPRVAASFKRRSAFGMPSLQIAKMEYRAEEKEMPDEENLSFGRGIISASDIDRIIKELAAYRNSIEMNIIPSVAIGKKLKQLGDDIYLFQYSFKQNYKTIIPRAEKHLHDFIVLTEIISENTPDRTNFIESLHKDRMLLKGLI